MYFDLLCIIVRIARRQKNFKFLLRVIDMDTIYFLLWERMDVKTYAAVIAVTFLRFKTSS